MMGGHRSITPNRPPKEDIGTFLVWAWQGPPSPHLTSRSCSLHDP